MRPDAIRILKLLDEIGALPSRRISEIIYGMGMGKVRTYGRNATMSHLRTMGQIGLVLSEARPSPTQSTAAANFHTLTPLGVRFLGIYDEAGPATQP